MAGTDPRRLRPGAVTSAPTASPARPADRRRRARRAPAVRPARCRSSGGRSRPAVTSVMWWWIATTLMPCARSAFSTGVTSCSSIATSPATIASASVPANAAHVFSPMRALIAAPCSRSVDVRPADGDLVDRPVLLAGMADDRRRAPRRRASAAAARVPRPSGAGASCAAWSIRSIAGLTRSRQIGGVAHPVHVHVEDARLLPEEMVVQRGDLEPVVEQRRHHRVDLVLGQHEVAHHHLLAAVALGHRHPAAEAERRRRRTAGDGDASVAARDVDLQHAVLEVAGPPSAVRTLARRAASPAPRPCPLPPGRRSTPPPSVPKLSSVRSCPPHGRHDVLDCVTPAAGRQADRTARETNDADHFGSRAAPAADGSLPCCWRSPARRSPGLRPRRRRRPSRRRTSSSCARTAPARACSPRHISRGWPGRRA